MNAETETVVEKKEPPKVKSPFLENIFDFVEIAMMALILVAILFAFFIRIVGVEGSSMYSTLEQGDRLVLTKMFYTAKQGDIVVINRENDTPLIKRVIAVGNQHVDIQDGLVYVDGKQLEESYLDEGCRTYVRNNPMTKLSVDVPDGYVFVLGDNRGNSLDSRSPDGIHCDNINGCISEEHILGKAVLRFLPFDKFGGLN